MSGRRAFGNIRKLSSGRYQARYRGPDNQHHKAPVTFQRKKQADEWLAAEQTLIARDTWTPPDKRAQPADTPDTTPTPEVPTFDQWADQWVETLPQTGRTPRTVQTYKYRLKRLRETFGDTHLDQITRADVDQWYKDTADNAHGRTKRGRTTRNDGRGIARSAYIVLSACMKDAVTAGHIPDTPCHVTRGGKLVKDIDAPRQVATPQEVHTAAQAMPDGEQLIILLAAWCAMRRGELLGLRRKDIDLKNGELHIRRQIQYLVDGGETVLKPKSDAGTRTISIPAALLPVIRAHMKTYVKSTPDALIFHRPARYDQSIHPNTLDRHWNDARKAAGIPWFKFHDLRHTGLTIYAQQGATLAELLHRGGHSDVEVALRYQHATAERDKALTTMMNTQIIA